jgi:hypothetical protein
MMTPCWDPFLRSCLFCLSRSGGIQLSTTSFAPILCDHEATRNNWLIKKNWLIVWRRSSWMMHQQCSLKDSICVCCETQPMSQLRDGDLSLWDSMLYVEAGCVNLHRPRIRPDLGCNRFTRKGICNREKCRFVPCVLKDLKAMEWYRVEKCWK